MAKKKSAKKLTRSERIKLRKRRKRVRILLLLLEIIVLSVLGVVAYGVFKLDKLDFNELDTEKLEVYKDTGDYTNIALFGLDSREGEIESGVRSDAMMVASINNETGEVKLVSVYRDTLTQQQDGTYDKANSAYAYGGPTDAVALLNRNFDLDINKYMSVNFNALVDVIDLLGGVEVDVMEEEVEYLNGYAVETQDIVGHHTPPVEGPGLQNLNGIQAVAYARIRYTEGDDYKRTERQRFILEQVFKKAKEANLPTLNKIINQVMPQVSTNFTTADLLGIAANAMNYQMGEKTGFPFDIDASENVIGLYGSYAYAIGHADNVSQLHAFLFGVQNYQPSQKVWEIDADVAYLTGTTGSVPYESTEGYEEPGQYGNESGTDVPEQSDIYNTDEQGW